MEAIYNSSEQDHDPKGFRRVKEFLVYVGF